MHGCHLESVVAIQIGEETRAIVLGPETSVGIGHLLQSALACFNGPTRLQMQRVEPVLIVWSKVQRVQLWSLASW